MRFTSVRFDRFRNIANASISVDSRQVMLVGHNGQGKTNFIEALYVLCYGSSFKAMNSKEMIAHGEKEFSLAATVLNDDGFEQLVEYSFSEGRRTVKIDGREIKDRKELIYNVPCIVFSHDDISFVRGEPEFRRRFFDQTMSMYNPLFFDDMRRYKAVLRQRNAAIKEERSSLVPIYDHQLATYGIDIQRERIKAVYEFNRIFPAMYKQVSRTDKEIRIEYLPSWGDCATADDAEDKLGRTLQRDFKLQTTASGVHRDRFIVMDEHGPFALTGSTGQLRLASLIFRMAQTAFFRNKTGKEPVLLVDDVLLELDIQRRGAFLDLMDGYSQAFFTFLPEEQYFSSLADVGSLVYDVSDGRFSKHEGR